jgi:hypothetical protein
VKRNFFPVLVGYASFVDTLALSVQGVRRKRFQHTVRMGRNCPIGSGKSNYARSQRGVCCVSGNPFELRYGRFRPNRRAVPDNRLILRSEVTPLTDQSVTRILEALFCRGYEARASQLELTFDTQTTVKFVAQHALWLRSVRKFGSTIYFGSPRAKWQIRVYEKAPGIVRTEFILRRPLLRDCGIESLDSVGKLAQMDVFAKFALCELRDKPTFPGVQGTPGRRSIRDLYTVCARKRLSFFWWTKICPEERGLRRMLGRLIW